jgi:hypothetical protein
MTHGERSSSAPPRSRPAGRFGLALALAVCGGGAALAGCGSSSDGAQPFPEFEGKWIVDVDTSAVSCPQTMSFGTVAFSPWSMSGTLPGMILGSVTLEAGVSTDLVETSGQCSFGFDVKGKYAVVSNPDPFTGQVPICPIPVNGDGSSVVLGAPSAAQPLTFQLDKPVPKMAQVAFIVGATDATVTIADLNGNLTPFPPCTFAAQVKLHKFAKP